MVMLHPGQEAEVGQGPRLLVELPASHAAAVGMAVDAGGGLTVAKHPRGRWIVQGAPGATGRLAVVSLSGGPMADALTVRLSLPGSASDAGSWELGDVPVDGRARVDVIAVEVTADGGWQVRSLVRPQVVTNRPRQQPAAGGLGGAGLGGAGLGTAGVGSAGAGGAGVAERPRSSRSAPVVVDEPVTVDVVVAVDRSASLQWAFEGPALAAVVTGLLTARSRALTPESAVRWFTCGSTSDDSDGPREVDAHDRTADELTRALRPPLPSSGSRAGSLLARMDAGQLLVSVTDRWPEPPLIAACEARGIRLAAILLGVPSEPTGWPADWRAQAERCTTSGVAVLPVGDGAGAQAAVRDWGMQRLAAPVRVAPEEVIR